MNGSELTSDNISLKKKEAIPRNNNENKNIISKNNKNNEDQNNHNQENSHKESNNENLRYQTIDIIINGKEFNTLNKRDNDGFKKEK